MIEGIDVSVPSKTVDNIYQRINNLMSELDYVAKGDKTVNGQYRFVSHDQVTAKVHPMLVKHGIVVLPTVTKWSQEGNRTVIELRIHFVKSECPTDQFSVDYIGFGVDSGDKGPGKAISYAYKYALLKTFCLETGDDPDNDAKAVYEPPRCLEFDMLLPADMTEKDRGRLTEFLLYSAEAAGKHVEDVKREAVQRMADFLNAFKNWKPKGK